MFPPQNTNEKNKKFIHLTFVPFLQVAKKLNIHPVPSAFQIRFGGCKGVVAQWPSLGYEKDLLYIGDSMKKFQSESHHLEIIEITKPG